MKQLFLLIFSIVLPLAAHAGTAERTKYVKSPFAGVCEGVAIVPYEAAKSEEDKAFWNRAINDCHVNAVVLPETGFFVTVNNRLGEAENQRNAADFLHRVGERTLNRLDYSNMISELIAHCAGDAGAEAAWFARMQKSANDLAASNPELGAFERDLYDQSKCDGRVQEWIDLARKKGGDFRSMLAMAKYTAGVGNTVASGLRRTEDAIGNVASKILKFETGIDLGSPDIVLPAEKVPLSDTEKERVDEMKQSVDYEAKTAVDKEVAKWTAKANEVGIDNAKMDPTFPTWFDSWYRESDRGRNPEAKSAKLHYNDQVGAQRQQHFNEYYKKYSDVLGSARVLAYLDSRDPNRADIKRAAEKLLANGKATREKTAKLLEKTKGPKTISDGIYSTQVEMSDHERIDQLENLLGNAAVVKDILKEGDADGRNAKDCRAAITVMNYTAAKNAQKGAFVTAGLIVAGVLAPEVAPALTGGVVTAGAAGTALGIGAGAVSLGSDIAKFEAAQRRTFTGGHSDQGTFGATEDVTNVSEFQDARNALVMNVAMQAAGYAARPAMQAIMAQNAAKYNTAAVMKQLKDKGMTEAQIKGIMQDFGSQDPAAKARGLTALAKAMDVDESELKTFQKLAEKQLITPEGTDQVKLYSQRLKELTAGMEPAEAKAARQAFNDRVQKIAEAVFGEKVSPHQKADAARLLLSASAYGETDEAVIKQVANSINSWDEGLYGLSRAFDQARANLTLPEIQALAPELRKQAAMKKALGQLGVNDPALVDQMCRCAGTCPLH